MILSKREIIDNQPSTLINHEKARNCELENQIFAVNHVKGPWENFEFFSHAFFDQSEVS